MIINATGPGARKWAKTYRSKCNGSSGKADEAAISGMGLVNGICIVIAELIEDFFNLLVLAGSAQFPDDPFQPVSEMLWSVLL